ncbi:MAG TPA: hypothetical protein VNZ52_09665 [Candidatus Thermoplasmatota archaeon]|nr:hypothetical protein [Candidatus Thermoplasmatota archaeon]
MNQGFVVVRFLDLEFPVEPGAKNLSVLLELAPTSLSTGPYALWLLDPEGNEVARVEGPAPLTLNLDATPHLPDKAGKWAYRFGIPADTPGAAVNEEVTFTITVDY